MRPVSKEEMVVAFCFDYFPFKSDVIGFVTQSAYFKLLNSYISLVMQCHSTFAILWLTLCRDDSQASW